MADSENIGGINVEIGATDGNLDAVLDRAEARIKAWVARVSATVEVGANVATPKGGRQGGGGASNSALEAKLDKLASALDRSSSKDIRAQQAAAEQVTINGVKVGGLSQLGTSLQKAIGAVPVDADVAPAKAALVELRQDTKQQPILIPTDTTGVDKAIDKIDLLSERLTMLAEQAREPIKFNISDPTAASGGGGGGGIRRGRGAAAGGGGEEDEGEAGNQGGRVQIMRPVVRTGSVPFVTDKSESALWKQRMREEKAEARAAAATQRQIEQEARAAQRQQAALFGEVIDNTAALGSTTRAPLYSETGSNPAQARTDRERELQDRRSNATRERVERQHREEAERLAGIPAAQPYRFPVRRGSGRGVGQVSTYQRDIEEQEAQRIAIQEATRVSAGRTARTQASGLGGFALGGGRGLIEAQAGLAAANAKVAKSERDIIAADRAGDLRARRSAVRDLADAENERADALKRVQSFSGAGAGIRNLLAVTAAGAAFGLGLEAINVAFQTAEKAAAPYFDQFTGYAQKTADLTSALADQARQQQGNAQGVTALKLAQTGLSTSALATIQPLIAQRVQIEAGNKALVDQIETFREAENLRRQGATAGIGGGGTGGILGTSLFGIPSTGEQVGNFLGRLGADARRAIAPRINASGRGLPSNFRGSTIEGAGGGASPESIRTAAAFARGLGQINDQLEKGGDGAAKLSRALTPMDARIEETARAFDNLSPEMASAIRENRLYSTAIAGSTDPLAAATEALLAINRAGTLTGPDEQLAALRIQQQNQRNSLPALQAAQAYARPGFLSGLERQQQVAIQTQIPAQAALANLANPPTPVGTGIIGRNSSEQARIKSLTSDTVDLQQQLDGYYAKGFSILKDTYQIPAPLLNTIQQVGQQIASTQAGIANEQAQYQVAQINYQLFIAKRTLSDIGGLTGHNFGAGQSYLGVLERQNLQLSRQSQLLQFGLAQRQINFQRAVAGFTVPGLTPAEQNARVEEARIETSYAQKQLDIQRKMFGNQVQIVDISNLRQGRDLAHQIGLLLQGRRVTIDTAAAQQRLERLSAQQAILVQEAGTYITKVNAKIAQAEADMGAVGAAAGRALSRIEVQGVSAAYNVGRAFFLGATGGFLGSGGGGGVHGSGSAVNPKSGNMPHASGALFNTQGATSLGPYGIAGEANSETVAILRNPRKFQMGGGGSSVVNFFGDIHIGSQADMDTLVRKITQSQGRTAALKGLRSPN